MYVCMCIHIWIYINIYIYIYMYIYVLKLIKHECSCLVYSRLGGRLNTTAGSFFLWLRWCATRSNSWRRKSKKKTFEWLRQMGGSAYRVAFLQKKTLSESCWFSPTSCMYPFISLKIAAAFGSCKYDFLAPVVFASCSEPSRITQNTCTSARTFRLGDYPQVI